MSDEVSKLQTHLNLLREEYVRLQSRHADLEKKYQVATAKAGDGDQNNFVARLLKTVSDLFDKDLYSDLAIKLADGSLRGHRFVLAARSDDWGVADLSIVTELDLSDVPHNVAFALMKWVYTDSIDITSDDSFLLNLLTLARRFVLAPLSDRCEKALMSSVNVRNCIRFYQTAEEIGAEVLKEHCSELISNHWNDFTSEDFVNMPAQLAYKMFRSKSEFPLHTAIRAKREDVVFLYLVEHDAQLPGKLNEIDSKGDLPLDLALQPQLEGIAKTLVKYKVDVNRTDHSGLCLLHKAIKRSDTYAASFLINNSANCNAATRLDKETALHMVASHTTASSTTNGVVNGNDEGLASIARSLLKHGANPNAQDNSGFTPLHRVIINHNEPVFSILLEQPDINLELQNAEGQTVLWLALADTPDTGVYESDSFASRLIKCGSSASAVNADTGDTLLHLAAKAGLEAAALFLANNGANVSTANQKGEIALHIACGKGLKKLAECLLEKGSNPNAQTHMPASTGFEEPDPFAVFRQTPLHIAIENKHSDIVKVFLHYKAKVTSGDNNLQIIPNFTLKDSQQQTVFGLALWQGYHDIATSLLTGGASVNDTNGDGHTLLHQAINKQDEASSLFLLNQQADSNAKTPDGSNCLQLAIRRQLMKVVDALCQRGANMNLMDATGNCPLWEALESGQQDIASVLVRHGCDTDMWGPGPGGCQQTMLHKAIDENNEESACFLIRSICDVNSARRPGPNGEGDEEAHDGQGPIHLAATWGLEKVVHCLLEYNVDVNAQDVEGKTPLHIAIENHHHTIISLLLSHPGLHVMIRDRQGMTSFAIAMTMKNNKAAQAILDREPTAAEQFDNKGRNFLHLAIQKSDIESVLFLISVRANVNSRIQDSTQLTPLHLAVRAGSEILVRNLLLAGARVNDLTPHKRNALHIAADADHAAICQVLIENGVDFDAVDSGTSNALHLSIQQGHLSTVRVLLTESQINAEAYNAKGMNPLHILGQYGKENAAAIFELFTECMPNYPLDKPDPNGNTIMLLAYFNGNGNLCRAVVRAGARLGMANAEGMSIFNAPVATKQLLFKLLDMLSKEPPWCEGDNCLECGAKFGITTRKHHCRHCGRLLCSKCSDKDMPILKYNITKPVRVCEICFDVLTLGAS